MKNLALALGLKEDATEQEIKDAAKALNLEVKDEKLVSIVNTEASAGDDDDEDDDKSKMDTYGKNPGKHIHNLHKKVAKMEEKYNKLHEDHKALKTEHADLKKKVNEMGKKSADDKVGTKINALVALGKVENTEEAKTKARTRLEKDFDLASDLYDALPEKKVNTTSNKVTKIIATAAEEHGKNSATAAAATKEATKDTGTPPAENTTEVVEIFNDKGEKVGTGMTKKIGLREAREELTK